tara:strand:- start:145 stop:1731 length:1587 start_codon:yes stop_codon:yes gene_type:complete
MQKCVGKDEAEDCKDDYYCVACSKQCTAAAGHKGDMCDITGLDIRSNWGETGGYPDTGGTKGKHWINCLNCLGYLAPNYPNEPNPYKNWVHEDIHSYRVDEMIKGNFSVPDTLSFDGSNYKMKLFGQQCTNYDENGNFKSWFCQNPARAVDPTLYSSFDQSLVGNLSSFIEGSMPSDSSFPTPDHQAYERRCCNAVKTMTKMGSDCSSDGSSIQWSPPKENEYKWFCQATKGFTGFVSGLYNSLPHGEPTQCVDYKMNPVDYYHCQNLSAEFDNIGVCSDEQKKFVDIVQTSNLNFPNGRFWACNKGPCGDGRNGITCPEGTYMSTDCSDEACCRDNTTGNCAVSKHGDACVTDADCESSGQDLRCTTWAPSGKPEGKYCGCSPSLDNMSFNSKFQRCTTPATDNFISCVDVNNKSYDINDCWGSVGVPDNCDIRKQRKFMYDNTKPTACSKPSNDCTNLPWTNPYLVESGHLGDTDINASQFDNYHYAQGGTSDDSEFKETGEIISENIETGVDIGLTFIEGLIGGE